MNARLTPPPPGRLAPLLSLWLILLVLSLGPGAYARAAPPRWSYTVTVVDAQRGLLAVDWSFAGGARRLCADMGGGEVAVADLRQVLPSGAAVPLRRDGACFQVAAPSQRPLRLRYRYDLSLMADRSGDPDYASRVGQSFVVNDQVLVLRPDPAPDQAEILATFHLPPGFAVGAHWDAAPPSPSPPPPGLTEVRFRYDAAQYDAGTYVALGPLRSLGALALPGGTALVTLLTGAGPVKADDAALRGWLQRTLATVARFYGELPGGRAHVILAPAAGSDEPGLFGSVLRRGWPSVMLLFGAQAEGASLWGHWLAVHELFHMGNPPTARKIPWFIEGFTTYYQDVLRARDGSRGEAEMWGDLYDGFRRHCDPQEGRSLRDESRELRRLHHYTRLYWGGACLAFRVDVAIREHSQGRRSLDTVMLDLRRRGQKEPLEEAEIIAALERELGPRAGMVRAHLDTRAPIVLEPLYQDLGIEPTGPETVRLRDDARLAALRRQIFRNPSAAPASP